jgi:gephyrin
MTQTGLRSEQLLKDSDILLSIWESWRTGASSSSVRLLSATSISIELIIFDCSIDSHVNAIQKGLDEADVIITTGGTSMGPADLLKPVIERNFDGTVHFGRVAIKPGKPTTFATIPVSSSGDGPGYKPVFALPGNPASALVTFYVFVLPALRKLAGWPSGSRSLPRVRVQVSSFRLLILV